MSRKLLLITPVFPPKGGGGVQRILKFAAYLRQHEWETTVVTRNFGEKIRWHDDSQLGLLPQESVIRIGEFVRHTSFIRRVVGRLAPIDSDYFWSRQVCQELPNFLKGDYDAIMSSGPPHSVHLIGQRISKKYRLPWVADFRDHFTLNPEYRPSSALHRKSDQRFERSILDASKAIICNTRINRREMIHRFGLHYHTKLHTIHNGFDRNDLAEAGTGLKADDQFSPSDCNLVYLGGLRGGRIDDSFFSVLESIGDMKFSRFNRILVHVFGDAGKRTELCTTLVKRGAVKLHQAVPANRMRAVLEQADGCVAWQSNKPQYRGTVPGKLYDYLAMEKPVFFLGQSNGEADRILRSFNLGRTAVPGNVNAGKEQLFQFVESLGIEHYRFLQQERYPVERFSRQFQAGQLATVLDSILVD